MKRVFVYEYLSGGCADTGTDDDALLSMGLAMRDAMVADLLAVPGISVSVASRAEALPPAEARTLSAGADETAFEFVARQAGLHDRVWLVAPESDGLLARFHGVVQNNAPGRWLGCDGDAISLTTTKRATLMKLARQGVATPLAFDGAPEVRRWVVKPDDGAGGVDTRVHTSQEAALDDWLLRSGAGAAMAIEPWVEGEPLSLSLLCKGAQAELLSVNRQQIHIDRKGVLSFDGVTVNVMDTADRRFATLRALASRVITLLPGLNGFVGVDLVWHPQRGPVLIEINPRVTCAYVGLSAALHRNLAAEVLQTAAPCGTGTARRHD